MGSNYKVISIAVDELCGKLRKRKSAELVNAKKGAHAKFRKDILNKMIESHVKPLRRIVGSLPINELADLAETLINIESLKERVTRPTQSIGGPIDVAAISKGDGFIWVKRKHYFEKDLNPRYMAKLARIAEGRQK